MNAAQRELWNRLQDFEFEEPNAALGFAERLARDNGYTVEFAQRVVTEYQRFLVLAATAEHPVAPSRDVDRAWLLHLTSGRSYWDDLCSDVLGFQLHHGPTAEIDGQESWRASAGQNWTAQTRISYERAFGAAPPRDIWPVPAKADRSEPNRAQAPDDIVVSRTSMAIVLASVGAMIAIAGAIPVVSGAATSTGWSMAMWTIAGVLIAFAAMIWFSRRTKWAPEDRRGGRGWRQLGMTGHTGASGSTMRG